VANGLYYSALFRQYGAEATWLPIDTSDELSGNGDAPEVPYEWVGAAPGPRRA
jgi:hypothetical protein